MLLCVYLSVSVCGCAKHVCLSLSLHVCVSVSGCGASVCICMCVCVCVCVRVRDTHRMAMKDPILPSQFSLPAKNRFVPTSLVDIVITSYRADPWRSSAQARSEKMLMNAREGHHL